MLFTSTGGAVAGLCQGSHPEHQKIPIQETKAQLESCKRIQDLFAKISSELSKEGYERTTQQCRDKIMVG